jgi:hypothetical protein
MSYIIAIWNNRTNTLKFYNMLKKYNINASVIAVPRVAGLKCGVCVKFYKQDYKFISNLLNNMNTSDFKGLYEVSEDGIRTLTIKN